MQRERDWLLKRGHLVPLASATGSQVMNMPEPIGYVRLHEAVDIVGRCLIGKSWSRTPDPREWETAVWTDANTDQVIRTIAEQCEAGKIEAAYRSALRGVDPLDCAVWRMPHWRNYFTTSTIDLDLPQIADGREIQPDAGHPPRRCTREIFIRRDSLDRFVAELPEAPLVLQTKLRYPSDEPLIREGLQAFADGRATGPLQAARLVYEKAEGPSPDQNRDRLRKLISAELKARAAKDRQ